MFKTSEKLILVKALIDLNQKNVRCMGHCDEGPWKGPLRVLRLKLDDGFDDELIRSHFRDLFDGPRHISMSLSSSFKGGPKRKSFAQLRARGRSAHPCLGQNMRRKKPKSKS